MILLRLLFALVIGALMLRSSEADNASDVLADVDKVRNAATLDLSPLMSNDNKGSHWILGVISPKPNGDVLQVHSSYIDGKTGNVVENPNGVDFFLVQGNVRLSAMLTGNGNRTDWSYSWQIPGTLFPPPISGPSNRRRPSSPLDGYRVFIKGGVVILRIDNETNSLVKLPMYQIVVPEWQDSVLPAFKNYKESDHLFLVENAPLNHAQLNKLLTDNNPLLSIGAYRTLLKANLLEPALLKELLLQVKDLKQAVLTYLLLRDAPNVARNSLLNVIMDVVRDNKDPDQLKGLALGAFAAYRSSDRQAGRAGYMVLEALEKKQVAADSGSSSTRYINDIISLSLLSLQRANIKVEQDTQAQVDKKIEGQNPLQRPN